MSEADGRAEKVRLRRDPREAEMDNEFMLRVTAPSVDDI